VSGGIALDSNGSAYITGITPSPDFPTKRAFQESYQGGPFDAFITKLNSQGSDLDYSTFIGGGGNEGINFLPQTAANIAVDRTGSVYIIGTTNSTETSANPFPITPGSQQENFGGGLTDIFITKLNPEGSDQIYSSFFGGSGADRGYGITLDETGAAYITGQTLSENFPTFLPPDFPGDPEDDIQLVDPSPEQGPILVQDNPTAGSLIPEIDLTDPNVEGVVPVPGVVNETGVFKITNREDAFVSKFAFEGVVITEFGGSVEISEDGATDIYSLKLAIQPTDSVTIDITPDDQSTVSPTSVTFTQADWDRPQRIEVTAVDDAVLEGPHDSTITHSISSADPNYSIIPVGEVIANIPDNEFGIIVQTSEADESDQVTALSTSEEGATAEFTVVLGNVPSANVIIPITSSDVGEGLVSVDIDAPDRPTEPSALIELVFTPDNWDIPQAVTVTGVDDVDETEDGDEDYIIEVGPAVSGDRNYDGLDAPDVTVTNIEFSISVTPTTGLITTEAGGTAEFTVVLGRQPTADVTMTIASSNIEEGTVSRSELVFNPSNWFEPQTVIVTGVDDGIDDGDREYTIAIGPAVSDDGNYNDQEVEALQVTNIDLNSPPPPGDPDVILTETASSTDVAEGGATDSYEVALGSPPIDNVEIAITVPDEQTITAPEILTFTPDNWNVAQMVMVGAVNDQVLEGPQESMIIHTAKSSDPDYNEIDINSIAVNITDNPGVRINQSQDSTTITEGGGTDAYSLTLTRQPEADVTIAIEPDDQSITSPASLTFTPDNWNIPQTVVVTAVRDQVVEGNHTSRITHTLTSADRSYDGIAVANISENNTIVSAGISITESDGSTEITEGGATDTYMVVLDALPSADVEIAIASDNQSEIAANIGSPNQPSRETILTFTPTNWDVPQAVMVSAVDDLAVESRHSSTITHGVSSIDSNYNSLPVDNLTVTITDNDVMPDEQFSLDIDDNGITEAFTDGFLLLRYQFGFRGNVLINGAIGSGARRQSAAEIEAYLDGAGEQLDLDGNGSIEALKDGMMALRYLFGFRGNALVNGLLGSDGTRDGNEIEALLQSYDI